MTALDDALDILNVRHAAIVAAYALANEPEQMAAIAEEALEKLGIDPAGLTLEGGMVPSVRLALDMTTWAWVENRAALAFDFSADGGSYQRSQLAAQATKMRRTAEDRAAVAGLAGFGWPAVEITRLLPWPDEDYRVSF